MCEGARPPEPSWLGLGILAEWSGVRVKAVRAIKFGNLADMTEVMIGKLMQHLRKCNCAHLGVNSGAGPGGGGHRMEKKDKGAAQGHQFFQVLPRRLFRDFGLRRRCVPWERRRFLDYDAARALLVQLFDHQQVGEHFGDRPAVCRWLPLEDLGGHVAQQQLEQTWGLFEHRNRSLNRGRRSALYLGPHAGWADCNPTKRRGKAPVRGIL